MSRVPQPSAKTAGKFSGATADWNSDQFADWLLRGFSTWFDRTSRGRRERGFQPALFDPDRPARPQVEDHVGLMAADAKAAFRQGILAAIGSWTIHMPQVVLRELLWLAAAYRPLGIAPLLYQLFVDGRLGTHAEGEDTRQRVFRALCAFPTPEARKFLVLMRESRYWRRELAAVFVRTQVAAGHAWIEQCHNVAAELQSLRRDDAIDLAVTFRLLVQDVGGLGPFMRSLPALRLPEDAWIVDSLIRGEEPVVSFEPLRDGWMVRCQGEAVDASTVFARREDARVFDAWVKAVIQKAPGQTLSRGSVRELYRTMKERKGAFLNKFAGPILSQGAM